MKCRSAAPASPMTVMDATWCKAPSLAPDADEFEFQDVGIRGPGRHFIHLPHASDRLSIERISNGRFQLLHLFVQLGDQRFHAVQLAVSPELLDLPA